LSTVTAQPCARRSHTRAVVVKQHNLVE